MLCKLYINVPFMLVMFKVVGLHSYIATVNKLSCRSQLSCALVDAHYMLWSMSIITQRLS